MDKKLLESIVKDRIANNIGIIYDKLPEGLPLNFEDISAIVQAYIENTEKN